MRVERADTLAVVIPAYRAAREVGEVVARTRRAAPAAHLYVVDDGSPDDTAGAARVAGADVLVQPRNRGKGVALARGIATALAGGATAIATLDADGQHPPESLPELVEPVLGGAVDLALGVRRRAAPMPVERRLSNWLSARLASRLAGQPVSDAQTGYRVFTAEVARRFQPTECHYDFEAAFLLAALAAGCRVRCVPVPTVYDGAPSHFKGLVDSWRVARVFGRYAGRIIRGRVA